MKSRDHRSQYQERLTSWYRNRQAEIELVDHVVEIIEPKLRNVRGYCQRACLEGKGYVIK